MDVSHSTEQFPEIQINQGVLYCLKIEAAQRLVKFEIENDVSLGVISGNKEITTILIFPGDSSNMTVETRKEFTGDVRRILQSCSSKRNPNNTERLLGLKKIEQEHKNHRV